MLDDTGTATGAAVADAPSTEQVELAWSCESEVDCRSGPLLVSADQTTDTSDTEPVIGRRGWPTWIGLTALVCVVAVAVGWLSLALYREDFTHVIPRTAPRPAVVAAPPMKSTPPAAKPAPTPKPTSLPAPTPPVRHEHPPAPPPAPKPARPQPETPAETFQRLLARDNISSRQSPADTDHDGHAVCQDVNAGMPISAIAASAVNMGDLSPAQVREVVFAYIAAYCPGP